MQTVCLSVLLLLMSFVPNVKLLPKQYEAMQYLMDDTTEEVVFGGAKSGGKSFLLAAWVISMAETYPKTHYFIARKELNDLRKYTKPTLAEFYEKCIGVDIEERAKFNGQDNYYTLLNGSKIYLLHAKDEPNDPLFERFGSMQFTGGVIEEAGEFVKMAYANLLISVGRWRNKEYNLLGKLLMTCNPKKNFLYDDFYLPHKEGRIPDHKKFVQTFAWENTHMSKHYLRQLQKLKDTNEIAYQRLWLGNWEYSDDDTALFHYADIKNLFEWKSAVKKDLNNRFMSIDPAAQGKDRTVIGVFYGKNYLQEILVFSQIDSDQLIKVIKDLQKHYEIPNASVIYDDDGVGNFISGFIKGAYRFKGGRKPLGRGDKKEYPNLRTQCYYRLSKDVKQGLMYIREQRKPVRQSIDRELSATKADKIDDDKMKYILKKEDIKKDLSGSPDFADMLMMSRAYKNRVKTKGATV